MASLRRVLWREPEKRVPRPGPQGCVWNPGEGKLRQNGRDGTSPWVLVSPALSTGRLRHNQCSGNMEQDGNTVILKAGGRVLAFYSAEHPDGIFGCEKLRLKLGQGGEGRTQEGGKKPREKCGFGRSSWKGRGREGGRREAEGTREGQVEAHPAGWGPREEAGLETPAQL